MQLGPDRFPDAFALKLAKDIVDRRTRRKAVARQVAPGTAGAQQIQDGVHRRPHVGLARSSAGARRRDQRLQPRPLRIPQIARIPVALAPVNPTVHLCPHRRSPSPQSSSPANHAIRSDILELLGHALTAIRRLIILRRPGRSAEGEINAGPQTKSFASDYKIWFYA